MSIDLDEYLNDKTLPPKIIVVAHAFLYYFSNQFNIYLY